MGVFRERVDRYVERYSKVMHLVSDVQGKLRDNLKPMNALPAINGSYYGSDGENALYLRVINRTECEAYGLEIAFYLDGQLKTSGGAVNADGSPLSEGEMMTLDFMEPDLAGAELQGHELSFELSVLDREEQPHRLEQTFSLPDPYFGKSYTCVLTGSFDQGFELTFLQ